ncbi:MAG TPA: RsmB/NOP family class I SAM-dependent RNA methyltransferase, partial [Sphingomicrobium sp.]|nr:RsmB/NOP family class I SAM-dependent RNA methyltransferase [Sphingomicrobium sp.]
MTPAARLQAAIEVLDDIIASARDSGAPADAIVTRYFKTRRYAGSKDRRAVRELVFAAIRRSAERPPSGRSAILGLAADQPQLKQLFGQPRGPASILPGEHAASAGSLPRWLHDEVSPLVDNAEWQALLERAPLDLRVNIDRASRDEMLSEFEGAEPTRLSPWGI